MNFAQSIVKQAQEKKRSVVFPEGDDVRILASALRLTTEGIASHVIIVGEPEKISHSADIASAKDTCEAVKNDTRISIVNPVCDVRTSEFAQKLYTMRKHKGMSEDEARAAVQNPLNFAAMLVHTREVHAMVAGATNTTADVLRSVLTIIRSAEGVKVVSSFFVIETDNRALGVNGCMIFSDCAIIPRPSAEELSHIAYSSARSCQTILKAIPRVAMLSFSTKGSAKHEEVTRVREATELLISRDPSLLVDGELQFDAALDKDVAANKAPQSQVAGAANVFIFPDLASGNIGYKIAQRIGGARAYGPFIQGLRAPASDLSRGCSVEDIVITSAAMLCQDA